MTAAALFAVQLQARRADIILASALGDALALNPRQPDVANALKAAFLGARAAGETIRRAIVHAEAPGCVIDLAARRANR